MTILITGAKGQLGTELSKYLEELKVDFIGIGIEELDITNKGAVMAYFNQVKPTIIFHCAAYTAVDKAEDEGKDVNYQVNVLGTENIAVASEAQGAVLVYISTDYVFDGKEQGSEYLETSQTNPLNEYGKTKLQGEKLVERIVSKHYIVRTSWVFGQYGPNFVFTMLRLAESHPTISVVNDQFGRPTWTRNLAEFLWYLVNTQQEYGTYHFSNQGSCNWYEFAKEILKDKEIEVIPVDSAQYPQKATRPVYSIMGLGKAKDTGFIIPTWQEALESMTQGITK